MIARLWHGRTTSELANAYLPYFDKTGLANYRSTPGNRGVILLTEEGGDQVDFYVFSFWESADAIRAFAGDDITRARYYPRDREFFAELEPAVRHFTVRTATMSLV